MRLFPPPLDIGLTEGFDPQKDIFGRSKLGLGLTNVLERVSDPTVFAIDAEWGSGKTVFLKMWAGMLRKGGFPVIYFDAFERDYVQDAFAAIAGEVTELLREANKANAPLAKKFLKAAANAGRVALKSSVKIGVKLATANAFSNTDLEAVIDEVSGELDDLSQYALERIASAKKEKDAVSSFKETLGKLPELLSFAEPKPLIIIIDELDRCRPTFALEVLERTKHFFSVPNVHFVFGVHLAQLESCVRTVYGVGVNERLYLQKFISFTYRLSDVADNPRLTNLAKYLNYLEKAMDFEATDKEFFALTRDAILHVSVQMKLSLRSVEKVMTVLAFTMSYLKSNERLFPPIVAGLCLLKVIEPDLYLKARQQELTFSQFTDFFEVNRWKIEGRHSTGAWFLEVWQAYLDPNAPSELVGQCRVGADINDRKASLAYVANEVIERFAHV